MGPAANESEKDDMRQPATSATLGSIHQNQEDDNTPATALPDDKNMNDIKTLCNDQGFKTIIAVNQNPKNPPQKTYLETEIDAYSAIDFTRKEPDDSQSNPPSNTKKAFTFNTPNPLPESEASQSKHEYSEVDKSKTRPKVPSKPTEVKIKAKQLENMLHLSTLSLARRSQDSAYHESQALDRVNSLPNLLVNDRRLPDSALTSRLSTAAPESDIQYAEIVNLSKASTVTTVRSVEATEYCDVLPESPPYVNNLYANTSRNSDEEESIYEDVTIPSENRPKTKPKVSKNVDVESPRKEHSDYENMSSPISDINFSFGRYENTETVNPALKHPGIFEVPKIYQNTSELIGKGVILEPPRQFSSFKPPASQGREKNRPQPLSLNPSASSCYENIPIDDTADNPSPHSSSAFTSSQYSGNSIASTATSSFQGIQVCYFPPTPPAEFYNKSLSYYVNPEEQQTGKVRGEPIASKSPVQTADRTSRSKIPKPLKQKPSFEQIQIPEEPAPPLPSVANSPPEDAAQKPANEQAVRLSAQRPTSGKAMRWYEKLGCIQTGSLQVSEPYGLPGERKKPKERRRSQFFVETDEPTHPEAQRSNEPQPCGNQSSYVNFQDVDSHLPGSSIQI
ncbi:Hypothetical protein NTJ_16229 [Nesidiocoris tenuis]|nr:Hypothetical protein NTJ_16229 [Nesidiocoris tenuis]